jgi:hypothetical protein
MEAGSEGVSVYVWRRPWQGMLVDSRAAHTTTLSFNLFDLSLSHQ